MTTEDVQKLFATAQSMQRDGAKTQEIVLHLVRSPLYVNAPVMSGGEAAEIDLHFSTGERIVFDRGEWRLLR
jgi:hypothetical protein